MKLSANVTFKLGERLNKFQLLPYGDNKPWRFLSNNCAVEMVPVCDQDARLVNEPPSRCDHLDIWPVQWGYPDSLISEHPDEVEQMRQDHFAGKHELEDGSYTWEHWLKNYGKAELWHSFRTPEMERVWLNWQTGPGSTLSAFAGLAGRIKREAAELIKFRADFYSGDECQTIFLSGCYCESLTQEEINNQPEHLAQQNKLAEKQAEVEAVKAKNRRVEEQSRRQRARQPVAKREVMDALGVKTDRGARAIFNRYKFDGWPQTQGELDRLVDKHNRRKKTRGEALGKRNRAAAAKRRGGNSNAGHEDF